MCPKWVTYEYCSNCLLFHTNKANIYLFIVKYTNLIQCKHPPRYLLALFIFFFYEKTCHKLLRHFCGHLEISFKKLVCWRYSRSKKEKKRNTPIYFNTNYRTEMKLVPIIMDYCLLQFDALKILLGVRLHGGLYLTSFFFSM